MTLDTTVSRASYVGTGTTGPFAFPFRIFAGSDLRVTVLSATSGLESTLAYPTGFSVTGVGGPSGSITLVQALAAGDLIVIRRAPSVTQDTSIRNQGPYFQSAIEDALDRIVMIAQAQQDELDRSFKVGETVDPTGLDMTLPDPTAGYVMTGTGLGFTMAPISSGATVLPGEGRTVATVSQYLSNNREFQLDDYVPVGVNIKTNVTDATTYLQTWSDAVIANQGRGKMRRGNYKTSAPWLLMKFAAGVYSYASFDLEGEKYPWEVDNATGVLGTRIIPTHKTTFAVGIQNGRAFRLANIVVLGQNDFSANLSTDLHEQMTNSTFVINACRDSRYSPYAGIVIDPFGTSLPADGGYPGMSAYYVASASGSSGGVFERVVARGFVANFLLSPNGTIANCSEMDFFTCWGAYGKVGFGIGQSQSRNIRWFGGNIVNHLYGFDGNTYGLQQGYAPKIFGCNMSGKFLFNVGTRWGDAQVFHGIHAESFGSIGFIGRGQAGTRQPVKFSGSEFYFGDWFGLGLFPDWHLVAYAQVEFDTCILATDSVTRPVPIRVYHLPGTSIKFRNTTFQNHQQNEFWLAPTQGFGQSTWYELQFDNSTFIDGSSRGPTPGEGPISHLSIKNQASDMDRCLAPVGAWLKFGTTGGLGDFYQIGNVEGNYSSSLGTLALTLGANGTASFTAADATIIRVGDLIYSNTAINTELYDGTVTFSVAWICLGIVTGIVGAVVTISGVPQNLANGNYALYTTYWPKFHQASTGDTHTNTTLDNVTNIASWAIGNKVKGAGIPVGTYIANIVGTTITLSKAATATAAGIRLYDADVYKLTGTAV